MDFSLLPISSLETGLTANKTSQALSGKPEQICQEFEKMFISKLFSSMTDSAQFEEKKGSAGLQTSWAWNMMADAVSKTLAESGQLGMGKELLSKVQQSLPKIAESGK
jgi:Rod binding domain-containing protein